jgi:nucleoid-associated protein YgaU
LKPDYADYIENSTEQSLYYRVANKIAAADRLPGPSALHEVSMSARRRWLEDPKNLRDGVKYRPPTLNRVAPDLDKLNPADFGLGEPADSNANYTMYQVKRGDTLSGIARDMLGSAHEFDRIFKANLNKLDSPDRIYPGQMLRIPKL